jgi:hypothetical protein
MQSYYFSEQGKIISKFQDILDDLGIDKESVRIPSLFETKTIKLNKEAQPIYDCIAENIQISRRFKRKIRNSAIQIIANFIRFRAKIIHQSTFWETISHFLKIMRFLKFIISCITSINFKLNFIIVKLTK